MTNKEKLRLLQSLSHKELAELVLIDLFDKMHFRRLRDYHGPLEEGKDLVFCREHPIDREEYIGVVIEKGEITGAVHSRLSAQAVYLQAETAITVPYRDLMRGSAFRLSKCYVVTPYPIDAYAKKSIEKKLGVQTHLVTFIDGPDLVGLVDEHIPQVFEGTLSSHSTYVRTLYSTNYLVKNLRQLGALEDRRLYDIYTGGDLVDFTPPPQRIPPNGDRYSIASLLQDNSVLYVFGAAGGGKTLALQKTVLDCISNPDGALVKSPAYMPVYVRAYSLQHSDVASSGGLLHTIKERAQRLGLDWSKLPSASNRILMMFDGFDEISSAEIRSAFLRCLADILADTHMKCVLTSRYSCAGELTEFTKTAPSANHRFVTLPPFGEQERTAFISRWFRRDYAEIEAMKRVLDHNASLRTLATTPLLLTLIAILHDAPKEKHGIYAERISKAQIYDSISELLLEKWDKLRGLDNAFRYRDKKYSLEELAFRGQTTGKKEFTEAEILSVFSTACKNIGISRREPRELLLEITARSCLLAKNENNNYEFYHFSFQEYFAGARLLRHNQEKELLSFIRDPWWFSPLEMYSGLKADISGIFPKWLRTTRDSYDRMLLLARCIQEAKYTDEEAKVAFFNKVLDLLRSMENVDDKWIHLLATMEELFWQNFLSVEKKLPEDLLFQVLAQIGSQPAVKRLARYQERLTTAPPRTLESYADAVERASSDEAVRALLHLYKKLRPKLKIRHLSFLRKVKDICAHYPRVFKESVGAINSDIGRLEGGNVLLGNNIGAMTTDQLICAIKSIAEFDLEGMFASLEMLLSTRNEGCLLVAAYEILQELMTCKMTTDEARAYNACQTALRKKVRRSLEKKANYARNISGLKEKLCHSEDPDIRRQLEKTERSLAETGDLDEALLVHVVRLKQATVKRTN